VRDRAGGAGAGEGIEDEVAGVGGDVNDAPEKALGFGCRKGLNLREQLVKVVALCLLVCSDFIGGPPSARCHPFSNLAEVPLDDWEAIAICPEVCTALRPRPLKRFG
jgi:hypothetical protein